MQTVYRIYWLLLPGGSSAVRIYTKQQYTELHSNTENTIRNIQNNKNTREIQFAHDKSYFNLSEINERRICLDSNWELQD
jgi:putative heme iron utilization protein